MLNIKEMIRKMTADDLIFWFVALTFLLLPTGTAPPLIVVGLALVVWIFSGRFLNVRQLFAKPLTWPVIVFIILPWTGLLYSQDLDLGMDYAMKTKYWIAFLLTAGLVLDEKRIHILNRFFWSGLLMGAILAFIQFSGFVKLHDSQFLGFGIVHTLISMYLIIGIMTASFYFKKTKNFLYKIFLLFLMAAFLFHLTVLRGRSGYLLFALFSPMISVNLTHQFSTRIKLGVCALLIISLALSPVVRNTISTTIVNLKAQKEKIIKGEDVAQFPRFYITRIALEQLAAHPLTGIGTGSLTKPTKLRGHEVTHPHNNILYMGVSFGIIGILACLWLFWNMFKISWYSRETSTGYFVLAICLVLFFGGIFDTHILNTGTLLLLAMGYGFLNFLEPNKTETSKS
jgi:O-antigen ligase